MKISTKESTHEGGGSTPDGAASGSIAVERRASQRRNGIGLARRIVFDAAEFLAKAGLSRVVAEYPKSGTIFSQGDAADAVFYIQKGKVKLAVVSPQGKEAT